MILEETVKAFVPAKGTSQRIPGKNFKKIKGVPLFLWAANNLNRVLPKQSIFIDSENEEILELADSEGFETLKRPERLANNETNGNELMLWEASQIDADIYIQHLPTMPFLSKSTLEQALAEVQDNFCDSATVIYKEDQYTWNDGSPTYDVDNLPDSTQLDETVIEGMGLYITGSDALKTSQTRITDSVATIELDPFEQINIETPDELEFSRTVANGLPPNSPYLDGLFDIKVPDEISLFISDVDGVLTKGGKYYTETGKQFRRFYVRDGLGLQALQDLGVKVGLITTTSEDKILETRAKDLGMDFYASGATDKRKVISEWMSSLSIDWDEVVYIGDDRNDLSVFESPCFTACPEDAIKQIKELSDLRLTKKGGEGCVREFADLFTENDQ